MGRPASFSLVVECPSAAVWSWYILIDCSCAGWSQLPQKLLDVHHVIFIIELGGGRPSMTGYNMVFFL